VQNRMESTHIRIPTGDFFRLISSTFRARIKRRSPACSVVSKH
jgi:hypothetical protein